MPSTKGFCARNSLKNVCSMPEAATRGLDALAGVFTFNSARISPTLSGCSVTKRRQGKTSVSGRKKASGSYDAKQGRVGFLQLMSQGKARSCATCHATNAYARRYSSTLSASTRTTSFSPSYETLRHAAFTQGVSFKTCKNSDTRPLHLSTSSMASPLHCFRLVSAWLPSQRPAITSAASFLFNFLASVSLPEAFRR